MQIWLDVFNFLWILLIIKLVSIGYNCILLSDERNILIFFEIIVRWIVDANGKMQTSNEQVIVAQAKVYKCSATVNFFKEASAIYPPMINNDQIYEHLKKSAVDLLGAKNFQVVEPLMGSEDFAFYSEVIPAGFFYIGIYNETFGSIHSPHSPYLKVDENALPVGAATHAAIAERYLHDRYISVSAVQPEWWRCGYVDFGSKGVNGNVGN